MKLHNLISGSALGALLAVASGVATADNHAEDLIKQAMSAGPDSISAQATIMDSDGTILREGSNGWTCLPHTMPGDNAPMCNDALWMKMMQAVGSKGDFEADGIGISYMLHGDYGAGVSNATPYHPDHKNADDYTETGPHLMIIVPKAMLEGITTDPSSGGPYVMWSDTPYAHIMIPVADGK
ncbi:MAG TPA: hypothetical protein VFG48_11785 [Xanthomonadales bacterium]|nr:hypothetical protein [Xanthomonadales bacterium]